MLQQPRGVGALTEGEWMRGDREDFVEEEGLGVLEMAYTSPRQ